MKKYNYGLGSGWHFHSHEHSLARQGIRTALPKIDYAKYYRAIPSVAVPVCDVIEPQLTDTEKVDEIGDVQFWQPDPSESPIFVRSREVIASFSDSAGGAILGAISGHGFQTGRYHVCVTEEEPELDLRDNMVGDFSILGEVRFKRPVKARNFGHLRVDHILMKKIKKAYSGEIPNEDMLIEIRDGIDKKVKPFNPRGDNINFMVLK